jgi:UDP-3-O-[3-hydroxymyristoyl] glucosamine N-acyltransferase
MKLLALKELDSSFSIVSGADWPHRIMGISHVTSPKENSFFFVKSKKFLKRIGEKDSTFNSSTLGVIFDQKFLAGLSIEEKDKLTSSYAWIAQVANIGLCMTVFSKPFYDEKFGNLNPYLDGRKLGNAEIDPSAEIADDVFIGEFVKIAAGVVIMPGVVIQSYSSVGKGSILFPNTVLYPYVSIGENSRVHANVTLGADGFGYVFGNGKHNKIWHLGGVTIGNDVEIGSGTTIDGGAFYATSIGDGTKIDNQCAIGHNAQIGSNCVICGKCAIAGSVEIGNFVVLGGAVGLQPDVRVGDGAQFAACAVVSEGVHVSAGAVLAGHPARPLKEWLRAQAKLRQLVL